MTGGVFQLKAVGIQEEYLYKNDGTGFNFIKQVYRKCENFSSQLIPLRFNGEVDFSKKIDIVIPNKGDYLSNLYLKIVLPPLVATSGLYAGWVNSVGHAIIEEVTLSIGDEIIDSYPGLYLEAIHELTSDSSISLANDVLLGKYAHIDSLKVNALTDSYYEIPLKFWFNDTISNALSLMSLTYSTIKISIKLADFSNMIVYDGLTPPLPVKIKEGLILAEYIYVDESIRAKSSNISTKFLISQVQCLSESIKESQSDIIHHCLLDFNHPSKEIIFFMREKINEDNNDWFNFSRRNMIPSTQVQSILDKASFFVDGHERVSLTEEATLRITQGLKSRNKATSKHIYTMSFCDSPDKWIPTGSLNFSRIGESRLTIHIKNGIVSPVKLFVFCKSFNIAHIENKMFGLDFYS